MRIAVSYKNWNYHRRQMLDNGGNPLFSHGPFLYDLEKDPQEAKNLSETYPEIAKMLPEMMDEW